MFAVFVLVSHDRAQPRQMYSSAASAGASSSLNDNKGALPSQSTHRGKPVRGSTSSQDWRQKQQHYATAYLTTAEFCQATCSQNAAGRLENGAGGQSKYYHGRAKTLKDKSSTYSQHRQTSGSPAAPSSQSPAKPQSASLNHQMPRSTYLYICRLCHMNNFRNQCKLIMSTWLCENSLVSII